MSKLSSDANIKAGSIRDIGRELSTVKIGVKLAFIYDANIPEEAVKDCQSSMLEAGFDVVKIEFGWRSALRFGRFCSCKLSQRYRLCPNS